MKEFIKNMLLGWCVFSGIVLTLLIILKLFPDLLAIPAGFFAWVIIHLAIL